MTVVLVAICDVPRTPLSLLYIGNELKKAGFHVRVFDISSFEIEGTAKEINKLNPLFVGISTMTGLQVFHSAVMSKKIKLLNENVPVVWGGIHPTSLPKECLSEEYLDSVVIGEGERTIVEVAKAYKGRYDLKGILGTGYKDKTGKIIVNKPRPQEKDIDNFSPDWELLDFNKAVRINKNSISIDYQTSRGCPFKCGFCYNEQFHNRRWRKHSVPHVLDNLKKLKERSDFNEVHIIDDNFYVIPSRAIEITDKLRELGMHPHQLKLRIEMFNEDIVRDMVKDSNCRVFTAFESGSERILKLINKGFNKEKMRKQFEMLAKYKNSLKIDIGGIIGFPTETWEEVKESIDFAREIGNIFPAASINLGTYLPFPGSDLYALALQNGFIPPERQEDWGKIDNFDMRNREEFLPWLSREKLDTYYFIDKYVKLMNHSKSTSWWRTFIKYFFHYTSNLRLKHAYFKHPFEVFTWEKFANRQFYNPHRNVKSSFQRDFKK
tara:strand:- start:4274 stop:5752 length:1479 start_codon:yes stop_codon:yes gene_type:complete